MALVLYVIHIQFVPEGNLVWQQNHSSVQKFIKNNLITIIHKVPSGRCSQCHDVIETIYNLIHYLKKKILKQKGGEQQMYKQILLVQQQSNYGMLYSLGVLLKWEVGNKLAEIS